MIGENNMRENTQEKELIEKNEENIFGKIKEFFKNLFRKKEVDVNNISNEELEMEMEKSEDFRNSIRNIEVDENNIFELQRRYHSGEISVEELTDEQIDVLCDLYDEQIADLRKRIASINQMIDNYKNNKK